MRVLPLGFALFPIVGVACFPSLDGLAGLATAGAEAGGQDGGPPSDGAKSTTDTGGDSPHGDASLDSPAGFDGGLLPNGGFEDPSGGGCGPGWVSNNGTLTRVSDARDGTTACEVCRVTDGMDVKLQTSLGSFPKVAAGTYRAEAYVKAIAGAPSPNGVSIGLFDQSTHVSGGGAPADANWQLLQVVLIVNQTLDVQVDITGNDKPNGACFLVDSVRLTQ